MKASDRDAQGSQHIPTGLESIEGSGRHQSSMLEEESLVSY
jgi:hypothetical protein